MNKSNLEPVKNFERLKEEQNRCLKECNENLSKWSKFQKDYMNLKNRLETLPDQLKYDITVPISKFAFVPGKLIHTNEILVLLGDNWFVEKSAKQACELIQRRLKNIQEHIERLNKEKETLNDQFSWTDDLLKEKKEFINIEEPLKEETKVNAKQTKTQMTEDEKRELRKKLQEKAVRTVLEIEKDIKSNLDAVHENSDDESQEEVEDVEEEEEKEDDESEKEENEEEEKKEESIDLKTLDSLKSMNLNGESKEALEKFVKEEEKAMKKLLNEYDETIDRENNQKMASMFLNMGSALDAKKKSSRKKGVHFEMTDETVDKYDDGNESDNYDYDNDDDYDDDDDELTDDDDNEIESSDRVQVSNQPAVIKIKHSIPSENSMRTLTNSSTVKIDTPADIYRIFHKPKSILKNRTVSSCSYEENRDDESNKENDKCANESDIKFEPHKAFTGEILERNVNLKTVSLEPNNESDKSTEEQTNRSKPVSKFKANKLATKS